MLRPYFVIVKYLNVNVILSWICILTRKNKENSKNFKGLIVDVLIWYFYVINLHSNSSNVSLQWNKGIKVTNGDSVTLGKLIQNTDNAFDEKNYLQANMTTLYFNYIVFIRY